jgi:hypothetical protein
MNVFVSISLIGTLTACVYPSIESGSGFIQIHTIAIDPKFPSLMASVTCRESLGCPASSFSYNIGYIDGVHFVDNSEIDMEYFSLIGKSPEDPNKLITSFSKNTIFRILNSADGSSDGHYQQSVNFYHETPSTPSHRVSVKLPRRECREPRDIHTDTYTYERQVIKFSVINESRAFIFVTTSTTNPGCADITVSEVLGDVVGIPEYLKSVPYVVYVVDLKVDGDGQPPVQYAGSLKAESPTQNAQRVRKKTTAKVREGDECQSCFNHTEEGIAIERVRPIGSLVLTADPIPDIGIRTSFLPRYRCYESSFAIDWNIYLGQMGRSRAMGTSSENCKRM